ncbi:MAG: chromate efflux transporter [Actinomycetota bacterium]
MEQRRVGFGRILLEWGRIGVTGFGGPPAHIALLRRLCVERNEWISEREFEDSIAACNLLPGPASTQLAIHSAYRVSGLVGAVIGGLAFIIPGLIAIVALAALFMAESPPEVVLALGAGAAAAVPAVAVSAGVNLARPSRSTASKHLRWIIYVLFGVAAAAVTGPYVVLVLLMCGFVEIAATRTGHTSASPFLLGTISVATTGGLMALAWTAFKVGALSYGGGFVIIPLMQNDAVSAHHWMTESQFLNAVALGQVTPGPVVLTVAVVGYAAAGMGGAMLAAAIAFGPSFIIVLAGARHFDALRTNDTVRGFLRGAGPAAIGAILGAAIPLTLALDHAWQAVVLAAAIIWTVGLRKGVVSCLLLAAVAGAAVMAFGGSVA